MERTGTQDMLRQYARLIARVGGNVQPGQEVFITAELDQPAFVERLVEECYLCGAKRVTVEWNHQPLTLLDCRYRSLESLGAVDAYEEARWRHYAQTRPCRITLISEDPSALNRVGPEGQEKLREAGRRTWPVYKPYRDALENNYQWVFACVPGPAWAKSLFPELETEEAAEKLWRLIFAVCRVEGDPVANWEAHNRELQARSAYLNGLPLKELRFRSGNGTDFTVGMIPQARFKGVLETTRGGVTFTPNLPTEECLITPMRGAAEGVVYGTKPFCFHGRSAEDFWIRFHEGRAVAWDARTNRALLDEIIGRDEGSAYLGECALVPWNSPVSESGVLFYNTLFDENAACHLALGKGYINSIENHLDRSLEECRALGVNDSQIHADFMIGAADTAVDAVCTDGREVPIFRQGTWAF